LKLKSPGSIDRFLRFSVIGGIGFIVDAGLMLALKPLLGLDALHARPVSVIAAVSITWFLNRRLTFFEAASQKRVQEWFRYATVNGIGALINVSIFYWLMLDVPELKDHPVVALSAASAVALAFNFWGSKSFAFRFNRVMSRDR
jgi:putative flippase GtrA